MGRLFSLSPGILSVFVKGERMSIQLVIPLGSPYSEDNRCQRTRDEGLTTFDKPTIIIIFSYVYHTPIITMFTLSPNVNIVKVHSRDSPG